MDSISVDGGGFRRKTKRVLSADERRRLGKQLQRLRESHDMKQSQVAEQIGVATGTVQAAEYNKYNVNRDTLEAYAAVFGTTVPKLLQPEAPMIPPSDPLLADLNREHLQIARRYMRAVKAVRAAVEFLLSDEPIVEEIADLVTQLQEASRHTTANRHLVYWTSIMLGHVDLLADIARRLDDEPDFAHTLVDLIEKDLKGKK